MQASIKEYVSSEAHKKERRDIDKQLTKVTQQISGTRYIVSPTHSATSVLTSLPQSLLHGVAVFQCFFVSCVCQLCLSASVSHPALFLLVNKAEHVHCVYSAASTMLIPVLDTG